VPIEAGVMTADRGKLALNHPLLKGARVASDLKP